MVDKIATCCYCGATTALRLRGKDNHELACGACGAPLHKLKALPEAAAPRKPAKSLPKAMKATKPKKKGKSKKKRSPSRRLFAELADFVEDIFD